ncbi:hypothetical protein HZC27_04565 [Candidatus Roizmanbacteria bacterium]|nr:hypothetical protein [Candidatus Roizmanbacteria bacterium]
MKTFLKTLLIFFFSLGSTFFIFFFSLRFSGFSTDSLKAALVKEQLYTNALAAVEKQVNSTNTDSAEDPLAILWPLLKKEVSPQYLQKKIETLVDDIAAWSTGKSNSPPTLSIQDLKEKIMKQNRQVISTLIEVSKEVRKQQEEAIRMAKESGQTVPEQGKLPAFDLEKILNSDFTLPLGQYLTWLKLLYFFTHTGLYIVGGIMLAEVILIMALSGGKKAKLRWIGFTLLFGFLLNIFPFFVVSAGAKLFLASMTQNGSSIPLFAINILTSLVNPFLAHYILNMQISMGVALASSILAFIASVVVL